MASTESVTQSTGFKYFSELMQLADLQDVLKCMHSRTGLDI
jgi:hypothetical protein